MTTLQQQLESAVSQIAADAAKLHTMVHGDDATTVSTDNGNVSSVAKAIADGVGDLLAAVGDAESAAASALASAAAAAANANSGLYANVLTKTADYTVVEADEGALFRVDCTSGPVIITLPDVSAFTTDFRVGVTKIDSSANAVTVARSGSNTINGATGVGVTAQWQTVNVIGDRETGTYIAADISATAALRAANNLSEVNAAIAFGNIKQAASESASGVVELATQAETNTGTDDARAITPLKLAAWSPSCAVVTLDAASDHLLIADASDGGKLKLVASTALTGADQTARDMAVSAYIKADVACSDAAGVYGRVFSDDFETDSLATKTNATYDGTNKLYSNAGSQSQISGGTNIGSMTSNGGLAAAFDGNTSQGASASAGLAATSGYNNTVGKTYGSAKILTRVDIYKATDNTNLCNTSGGTGYKVEGSSDGFSSTTTLYSGTYPDSTALVSIVSGIAATACTSFRLNVNGNGTNVCSVCEVKFYETTSTTDVTLISSATTVASVPSDLSIYFLVNDIDSVTNGTDRKIYGTRNGGAEWTEGSYTVIGIFGSDKLIRVDINVAGQSSGTSVAWKATTHNGKSQQFKQATGFATAA